MLLEYYAPIPRKKFADQALQCSDRHAYQDEWKFYPALLNPQNDGKRQVRLLLLAHNNRPEQDLKYLTGTGVSAAAIWYMREQLDKSGFDQVKIVASSGFNTEKCHVMAKAKAPINVIGTGSYLPSIWSETYATADIICYDGQFKVKSGREFLIKDYQDRYGFKQPKL